MGFEVPKVHAKPKVPLLLSVDVDVELSATSLHHVCLRAAMLLTMRLMDSTSETVSQPQLNTCFCKTGCDHGVSSQQ